MNENIEIQSVLNKLGLTQQEAKILFKNFVKSYLNENCYIEMHIDYNHILQDGIKHTDFEVSVTLYDENEKLLYDTASVSTLS